MKIKGGLVHAKDPDLSWQEGIGPVQHRAGIHSPDGFNARDLSVRVHSGVGSPGTVHLDFMIEELLKYHLEFSLDCSQFGLNLPAVKFRAIICERQLEVPHPIRL